MRMLAGFRSRCTMPDLVRGAKPGHHLARERQRPRDGQLAFRREQAREVGAVHERHRDVLDAVDLAEVVNADDVGVRDLPREHELALEPALELLRSPADPSPA